jgi:hypothetical protein
MSSSEFDVFLCHNSKDKPIIRIVDKALRDYGMSTWMDEVDLAPGARWRPAISDMIAGVKSVAIFIGENGLGPYQHKEVEDVLSRLSDEGRPIIPVLLPNTEPPEKIPSFLLKCSYGDDLSDFTFVKMGAGNSVSRLIHGITGTAPCKEKSDLFSSLQLDYERAYSQFELESIPLEIGRIAESLRVLSSEHGKIAKSLSDLCLEYENKKHKLQSIENKLQQIREHRKSKSSDLVNRLEVFLKSEKKDLYKYVSKQMEKEMSKSLSEKLVALDAYTQLQETVEHLIAVIPAALLAEDNGDTYNYRALVKAWRHGPLEQFWDDDEYVDDLVRVYSEALQTLERKVCTSYKMNDDLQAKLKTIMNSFKSQFANY